MIDAFPRWIDAPDASQALVSCPEPPEAVRELAGVAGLVAERFTLMTYLGGPGTIIQPANGRVDPLAPARTLTLLALIRAFENFPLFTADEILLPHGGFAPAAWLSEQISALTAHTRLLFSPSPHDVRIAVHRLKNALAPIVGRRDLIESCHGLGYRFRIWPSLITVLICNPAVTNMLRNC